MRATATTTPIQLIGNTDTSGADYGSKSYVAYSPTGAVNAAGVVLHEPGAAGADPNSIDFSNAARWDFSKLALSYVLEPGRALFAKTASGSVDVDVLVGGER
jgi:hypothetical protein